MKLKDLKIRTQLRIGFGIMLLVVAVLGFVSYEQTNKIAHQTALMYNHPLKVRRAVGALRFDISGIHGEMKDLFLPQKEINIEGINKNIMLHQFSGNSQIEIIYKHFLGPRSDVDSLKHSFIVWTSMRDETFRLLRMGKVEEAVSRILSGGIEHKQVELVYKNLDKIDDFALSKAESLNQASQKLNETLRLKLLVLIVTFLVLLLLISYMLTNAVRVPMDALLLATKRFMNGDFTARSSYDSKNEFGEMSTSLNMMFDTINSNLELSKQENQLTGAMLKEDDAHKFFQNTLYMLMNFTRSQMAAAYLVSDDNKSFEHFESVGIDDEAKKSFSVAMSEGEFGAAVTSQTIQYLKNVPDSTRFIFNTVKGKFIPNEIITIPMVSRRKVIAIISLASVNGFNPNSLELIEKIHATFTTRIEGILAYHRIKEILTRLEAQNRELEVQQTELTALSSKLTTQNRELEIQKDQLSEVNKLKTSFLSNMSHELRTPLNSVIALSGVLSRKLAKIIPEEELSYLEIIERNGRNLLMIINDVLDISRVESGMEEVEARKFELCHAIEDVVSMINPQAVEKDIYLRFETCESPVQIISDASKFRHIMQNLIANAVKFTEKGGINVSVILHEKKVDIIVKDSGIGISAEHLPHIFDEFRQADSGVSRRFGGTGLGLSIAKKYAILLGGTITVNSVPDTGSEFKLILPLVFDEKFNSTDNIEDSEVVHKVVIPTLPKVSGDTKTVMLIEDSKPAVIQLKYFLEENGYNVVVGKDGNEAIGLFKSVIPDAIILDLMMPGIDGFQVLQTIRNEDVTAHIPVLILTAKFLNKEDLKFLKRNNVHQLIQKGDIKRQELVQVVQEMIFGKKIETPKPVREVKQIVGKPTVLVVEDNPDNMITVKAILADEYIVVEAVNGREGIEKANEYLPDLILMDIALPEMDGIQAFKVIRSDSRLQHIPVIALTASALLEDRELVLSHGFDAFIAKPIDENIFFSTFKQTLYGK